MHPSVGRKHTSRWTRVDRKLDRVCDGVGGVIVWKSSHDHMYTCRVLDRSHFDVDEIALFKVNA